MIYDYWMGRLSGSEFKVLSCLCRKTYGWQKLDDKVSLSQMREMTQLSINSIRTALSRLEELGVIICKRAERHTTWYKMNVQDQDAILEIPTITEKNCMKKKDTEKQSVSNIDIANIDISKNAISNIDVPISKIDTDDAKSVSNIDNTKEIYKETIQKKERRRFTPPSPAEVQDYLNSKGITTFSGEMFCDFYQARGWMIGKNKMKDWRAAVRTWKNRDSRPTKEQKLFRSRDPFLESLPLDMAEDFIKSLNKEEHIGQDNSRDGVLLPRADSD